MNAFARPKLALLLAAFVSLAPFQLSAQETRKDAVVKVPLALADAQTVTVQAEGAGSVIKVNSTDPVAALVFKVVHDEQGRRMAFLRNWSGVSHC